MVRDKGYWAWITVSLLAAVGLTITYGRLPTAHSLWLGFSLRRLVVLGLVWGWIALWVWGGVTRAWGPLQASRRGWLWAWGSVLGLSFALYLLPPERFEWKYRALWQGLLPFWGWWVWSALGAVGYGLWKQGYFSPQVLPPRPRWAKALGGFVLGWGVFALLIWSLGLGWNPPFKLYWQGVGVPLLSAQVFGVSVLLIGGVVLMTRLRPHGPVLLRGLARWSDLLVFLALWGIAAGVWLLTSPVDSYFLPRPYPPNGLDYPASDAANWDLSAWQGVLGYGYAAHPWANRGVPYHHHQGYIGLLALLHVFFPSYPVFLWGYVLLLALTCALLYGMGSTLHSRWAGLLLAGLNMVWEVSKMHGADWAVTAHSRQLMTEPALRMVFIAAFWLVALWQRDPWPRKWALLGVGALVGLGSLFRAEAYLLVALPLAFIFGDTLDNKGWKQRVKHFGVSALLFWVGVFGVYLPWMGRSMVLSNHLKEPVKNSPWFFWWSVAPGLNPQFRQQHIQDTSAQLPKPEDEYVLIDQVVLGGGIAEKLFEETPQDPLKRTVQAIVHWWALNSENLLLVLPPTGRFYTLYDAIHQGSPYWNRLEGRRWFQLRWSDGQMLVFNVLLISVGLAALYTDRKTRGFLPIAGATVALYTLGLAGAREAGGRYGVPVDWVLPLFYAIGIAELVRLGWQWLSGGQTSWWWERWVPSMPTSAAIKLGRGVMALSWLMVGLEFVAIGWVAYADKGGPTRWRPSTPQQIVQRLEQWQVWDELPWSKQALQQALAKKTVMYQWGYAFYPRNLAPGVDCEDLCRHQEITVPLFFFDGISSMGRFRFYLEGVRAEEPLRDGSEMIVLYCKPDPNLFQRLQALALVLYEPDGKIHVWVRPDQPDLQCPLPPLTVEDDRASLLAGVAP